MVVTGGLRLLLWWFLDGFGGFLPWFGGGGLFFSGDSFRWFSVFLMVVFRWFWTILVGSRWF